MAWTLAELSKIETDLLRKSVIDTLLWRANMLELVPWETIGQLSTGVVAIQDLPSVGFRALNAGYTESTGHLKHKTESVALLGGDIDTDKAIARAKNTIADARALMQELMLKAMAYHMNYVFIEGNPEANPTNYEFKGIRKRIDDLYTDGYTSQKFACPTTAGDGFLLSSGESHKFIDGLYQLMYSMPEGKPDVLLMSQKCLLAANSALRREKLLTTTQDIFGRWVDNFMGARMIDMGVKADQSTQIITDTESTAGAVDGSGECTSIYAVKFGEGDMTWGICEYPLEVEDLGQLETKPVYRTRVDFPCGLATVDPRSLGRMYGIIPDASD